LGDPARPGIEVAAGELGVESPGEYKILETFLTGELDIFYYLVLLLY